MRPFAAGFLASLCCLALCSTAVYALYETPDHLPDQVAPGKQSGSNQCRRRWGDSNPNANCQNLYLNGPDDFCLYSAKTKTNIEDVEPDVVAFCSRKGYGTRLLPQGMITGLHFIKTPTYGQIALVGDFTKLNLNPKDDGTELDNAGPTGLGNPHGALVYTSLWTNGKKYERSHYWHQFIGYDEASIRWCNPHSSKGYLYCPHIYDRMGSEWNDPARYEKGIFESCDGQEGEVPGFYNGKQWKQGQKPEPEPHPVGKTFNCKRAKGVEGLGAHARLVPGS
ncbi:unnamed protein product [Parajaminaea phylloscopi]